MLDRNLSKTEVPGVAIVTVNLAAEMRLCRNGDRPGSEAS